MSKKKLGGYVTKPGFMTKLKEGIHQKNKQTAEGYDQKWIGRYSQLREEFNLMESITKLVKEVQAEYASLPSGYCRWVKADERLPESKGQYFSRVGGHPIVMTYNGNAEEFMKSYRGENIEWLEESTSIDARQYSFEDLQKCWDASWDWHWNEVYGKLPNKFKNREQYLSTLNTK